MAVNGGTEHGGSTAYEPLDSYAVGEVTFPEECRELIPSRALNAADIRHEIDSLINHKDVLRTKKPHPLQLEFENEFNDATRRTPAFKARLDRIQYAVTMLREDLSPRALQVRAFNENSTPEALRGDLQKTVKVCEAQRNAILEAIRAQVASAIIAKQYATIDTERPVEEKKPEAQKPTPAGAPAPSQPAGDSGIPLQPVTLPDDFELQLTTGQAAVQLLDSIIKKVAQIRSEATSKKFDLDEILALIDRIEPDKGEESIKSIAEYIAARSPNALKALDKHTSSINDQYSKRHEEIAELEKIAQNFVSEKEAAAFDIQDYLGKPMRYKPEQIKAMRIQAMGKTDEFKQQLQARKEQTSRLTSGVEQMNTIKQMANQFVRDNTTVSNLLNIDNLSAAQMSLVDIDPVAQSIAARGERAVRELADMHLKHSQNCSSLMAQQQRFKQYEKERARLDDLEAKRQKQEAKRKAEEDARRAEEEAKRKAEEEAKVLEMASGKPADASEPEKPGLKLAQIQSTLYTRKTEQLWNSLSPMLERTILEIESAHNRVESAKPENGGESFA